MDKGRGRTTTAKNGRWAVNAADGNGGERAKAARWQSRRAALMHRGQCRACFRGLLCRGGCLLCRVLSCSARLHRTLPGQVGHLPRFAGYRGAVLSICRVCRSFAGRDRLLPAKTPSGREVDKEAGGAKAPPVWSLLWVFTHLVFWGCLPGWTFGCSTAWPVLGIYPVGLFRVFTRADRFGCLPARSVLGIYPVGLLRAFARAVSCSGTAP